MADPLPAARVPDWLPSRLALVDPVFGLMLRNGLSASLGSAFSASILLGYQTQISRRRLQFSCGHTRGRGVWLRIWRHQEQRPRWYWSMRTSLSMSTDFLTLSSDWDWLPREDRGIPGELSSATVAKPGLAGVCGLVAGEDLALPANKGAGTAVKAA